MDNITFTPESDKILQVYPIQKNGLSALPYLLISFLLICVEATRLRIRYTKSPSRPKAPYEKPLWFAHLDPFLGLDVAYFCAKALTQHNFLQWLEKLIRKYGGTLTYLSFGRQAILTADPENLKTMLSIRFNDYGLGPTRKSSLKALLGGGIFNSDGAAWKHHRTVLRPFASRVGATEMSVMETHVQHLIDAIPTEGSTIDLQKKFSSFTIDTTTELFLGVSTNLLSSPQSMQAKGQKFAAAFDYAQRAASGIEDYSVISILRKLIFGDAQLRDSINYIHDFIDDTVQNAISSQDIPQRGDEKPLLHALLAEGRTREDIKDDVVNILLAGKDTMTSFLSSIWYVLSQRPDVYGKIRHEVTVLDGRRPTKDDLISFKYLNSVLQEVLRMYPPVSLNQRTAEVDTILPRGGGKDGKSPMSVKRGSSVGYSVYAMHRLPEYFGQDAETFRPERWAMIRPAWAFMPFHGGPRMCIGQQLALTWAKYSTVRLIQHFDHLEDRNEKPWEEKLGLNCSSRHGVQVCFVAKEGSATNAVRTA